TNSGNGNLAATKGQHVAHLLEHVGRRDNAVDILDTREFENLPDQLAAVHIRTLGLVHDAEQLDELLHFELPLGGVVYRRTGPEEVKDPNYVVGVDFDKVREPIRPGDAD